VRLPPRRISRQAAAAAPRALPTGPLLPPGREAPPTLLAPLCSLFPRPNLFVICLYVSAVLRERLGTGLHQGWEAT